MDPNLPERFNAALDVLAGRSPFLVFTLRAKDRIPQLLTLLGSLQGALPDTPVLSSFDQRVWDMGFRSLDESIETLASTHGIRTRIAVKRYLRTNIALPADVKEDLDRMVGLGLDRDPARGSDSSAGQSV
jgi:hypothetical protein